MCPSSQTESLVELGFEPGCPPGAILTQSPLLLPADSAGSLRRGDHVLNMALAMHSWVLPSAHFAARLLTLYPPRGHKQWVEGGGQRRESLWGRGEQLGLRCWMTEP